MSDNTEYNLGFDDGLALGKAEVEAMRAEVERLTYNGIHTCHDGCPRLPCVQRREIERLREAMQWIADDPDLPRPFDTYLRDTLAITPEQGHE